MEVSREQNSQSTPQKIGKDNARNYIVGHRGAGNSAPGSTIAALEKAAELKLEWVEFDVRLTADGHLVIANADDLFECSGQAIKISESTLDQLLQVNVAHSFKNTSAVHTIPLFEEALQFCIEHDIRAQIELKSDPGKDPNKNRALAQAVVATMSQAHLAFKEEQRPLITSFSSECLLAIQHFSEAPFDTGLLIHSGLTDQWEKTAQAVNPDYVHLYGGVVDGNIRLTEKFGRTVRDAGYALNAYKVNTVEDAQAAVTAGAIRFTSDEPERLLE